MKNYSLSHNSWDWREDYAILRVLTSKQYTMGENVSAFEREFAARMGTDNAVMVNSGSSANLIMLHAMKLKFGWKEGSEVIVPAVSWSTTYFPITQLGLVPVFVDVDTNYNIESNGIHNAISDKTVAIFAVNLLGMPARLYRLRQLCMEKKIHLLEDNCESLGATIGNQQAGTIGYAGTYSFFFSHHMQTMEGGMIVTRDDELADYMRSLRAHGWIRDLKTNVFGTFDDPWKDKFTFILPGYCMRPLEMSGAVGRVQLKKLDKQLIQRRKNAKIFTELFHDQNIQHDDFQTESSWFGFGMVLSKPIRVRLIEEFKKNGIESRPIVAGNFLKQPVMKLIPHRIASSTKNADLLDRNGLFLGNDSRDLTKQLQLANKILRSL